MAHFRRRPWLAWLALVLSLPIISVALAVEHGVLLGAGVALAGGAGHFIERWAYEPQSEFLISQNDIDKDPLSMFGPSEAVSCPLR
jgi:hypothetical protein